MVRSTATATPRRSRLRAAATEADKTGSRAAILEAARTEFASRGLTGARVNLIAARAGVNKQLIYYYFGSKDDLYRHALESVYTEIRTQERSLNMGALPPEQAMERLIGFSFDYLARHPDFIGLLNHENAQGAQHVRESPAIRDTNSPLIDLIARTLARGIRAKVFRRGVDPVELYISVAGMSYFFFSNRLTLSSIFGRDLGSVDAIDSYRRHVVTFALAAIKR